jgi:hypothetical protein
MADQLPLEKNLHELSKGLPVLPAGGRKVLVEWAPWLALVGGIFALWAAWGLWHWAHLANSLINYANSISAAYGGEPVGSRLTVGIWLGIAVLAVEGILYLLAFPGLRDRKKAGWNLLYWGAMLNIAYGLVVMFTDYGSVGNFIGSLIGSAISFYFLFQIRPAYKDAGTKA